MLQAAIRTASCHLCKTKKSIDKIQFCTQNNRQSRRPKCRKKYCTRCVYKLNIEPTLVQNDPANWICPACMNLCICKKCMLKGSSNQSVLRKSPRTRRSMSKVENSPNKRRKKSNGVASNSHLDASNPHLDATRLSSPPLEPPPPFPGPPPPDISSPDFGSPPFPSPSHHQMRIKREPEKDHETGMQLNFGPLHPHHSNSSCRYSPPPSSTDDGDDSDARDTHSMSSNHINGVENGARNPSHNSPPSRCSIRTNGGKTGSSFDSRSSSASSSIEELQPQHLSRNSSQVKLATLSAAPTSSPPPSLSTALSSLSQGLLSSSALPIALPSLQPPTLGSCDPCTSSNHDMSSSISTRSSAKSVVNARPPTRDAGINSKLVDLLQLPSLIQELTPKPTPPVRRTSHEASLVFGERQRETFGDDNFDAEKKLDWKLLNFDTNLEEFKTIMKSQMRELSKLGHTRNSEKPEDFAQTEMEIFEKFDSSLTGFTRGVKSQILDMVSVFRSQTRKLERYIQSERNINTHLRQQIN